MRNSLIHDIAVSAALSIVTMLLLSVYARSPPGWGDDDAAYILQAKALEAGTMLQEVRTSTELQRASDWHVGPDAYPWGYPVLLALMDSTTDGSNASFRYATASTLLLVLIGIYSLCRLFDLTPWSAAAVSGLLCWQPYVLDNSAAIASDIPFWALTMLSSCLTVAALCPKPHMRWTDYAIVFGAATLAVLSFAIRSNGAATMAASAMAMLISPWLSKTSPSWRILTLYLTVLVVGVASYFAIFPDGSLAHVSYLTLDPVLLAKQFVQQLRNLGKFIPIAVLPSPLELPAAIALLGCALVGAFRLRTASISLVLFVLSHVGLITMFTLDGGVRYLYAALPAMAILAIHGVTRFSGRADSRMSRIAIAVIVLVGSAGVAMKDRHAFLPKQSPGPDAVASKEMFQYIVAHTSHDQWVGFFKPRALRLHTGRPSIAVSTPESLSKVQVVVLHKFAGNTTQLPLESLANSTDFMLSYTNVAYKIYLRRPVL